MIVAICMFAFFLNPGRGEIIVANNVFLLPNPGRGDLIAILNPGRGDIIVAKSFVTLCSETPAWGDIIIAKLLCPSFLNPGRGDIIVAKSFAFLLPKPRHGAKLL